MSKKRLPLAAVFLIDIVLAGIILLTFAFFHHVLPAMQAKAAAAERAAAAAAVTPAPTAEPDPITEETDKRTEWQIKFAEHFTEETVVTENSYHSPYVSVDVETVHTENWRGEPVVYYVADIYISDMSCFTAKTPNDELQYFLTSEVDALDLEADAILSMNGDFFCYQNYGFILRNGELYRNDPSYCDVCVLYDDGRVDCLKRGQYTNEEILEKGAVQVWNFGPSLLDENGIAYSYFDVSTNIGYDNPRSALGYYEPGHYCFVVVDGRQESSFGLSLYALADIFQSLGCTKAYNLDGGGSSVMLFNHERFSSQSNGGSRQLGDILVIRESELAG